MAEEQVCGLALVTGASSGIGCEFARELAARGADLILVARDEARLTELAEELRDAHGCRAEVLRADLCDERQLTAVESRLSEDSDIDLLVNNAGFGVSGYFADLDIAASQGQIDLNVTALVRLAHAALPSMRAARRGGIINIASTAAFTPGPMMAVYSATKAFVLAFTEGLAAELRSEGIKVTTVCPGFTRTEFQQRGNYDTGSIPTLAWQSPANVVAEALSGYSRGKVVTVSGAQNRLLVGLLRMLPRSAIPGLVARSLSKGDS